MNKVIARIKGGLGNQLFCYAAARRLALLNNAELVIDEVSGFIRDRLYRRMYALHHFSIPARKATPAERLEPFERYRRAIRKILARRQPFAARRYVEQEQLDFDGRLLNLRVRSSIYLDGLWQSEGYFRDVEQTIRDDLRIIPPADSLNQRISEEIQNSNAVALHVRWFDTPDSAATHNVAVDYYRRAITLIEGRVKSAKYFVFSDNPEAARAKLALPDGRATFVSHNQGDEKSYADLWLMTQCQHFIIANSTFGWWGAWLSKHLEKVVISPGIRLEGKAAWGFAGLIPGRWLQI